MHPVPHATDVSRFAIFVFFVVEPTGKNLTAMTVIVVIMLVILPLTAAVVVKAKVGAMTLMLVPTIMWRCSMVLLLPPSPTRCDAEAQVESGKKEPRGFAESLNMVWFIS